MVQMRLLITGLNKSSHTYQIVSTYLPNVPILFPLKTPENQRFSGVLRRFKIGTLARNGLRKVLLVVS